MKNRWRLSLAIMFVVTVGRVGPVAAAEALPPEVVATMFRLRVVAAALDTAAVTTPFPGPTTGFDPAASVIGKSLVDRGVPRAWLRDGWGHPILYWSNGSDYAVASFGSDGVPQFDYSLDPPYDAVPKGWAGMDPTDDLIVVDGIAYRGPSSQTELLRRAMGDLRSDGTAVESFAVDNNIYPGPVAPIDVASRIAHDLEPTYIRVMPAIDPWGHPYLFWSNTMAYALVSYGVDGQPEFPYDTWGRAEFEALTPEPTTHVGQDLVFVNWRFVRWPAILPNP